MRNPLIDLARLNYTKRNCVGTGVVLINIDINNSSTDIRRKLLKSICDSGCLIQDLPLFIRHHKAFNTILIDIPVPIYSYHKTNGTIRPRDTVQTSWQEMFTSLRIPSNLSTETRPEISPFLLISSTSTSDDLATPPPNAQTGSPHTPTDPQLCALI